MNRAERLPILRDRARNGVCSGIPTGRSLFACVVSASRFRVDGSAAAEFPQIVQFAVAPSLVASTMHGGGRIVRSDTDEKPFDLDLMPSLAGAMSNSMSLFKLHRSRELVSM